MFGFYKKTRNVLTTLKVFRNLFIWNKFTIKFSLGANWIVVNTPILGKKDTLAALPKGFENPFNGIARA
jgi:hypothetical protein